jgi:cell division protein FtsI (penicillin-binding protein 3)
MTDRDDDLIRVLAEEAGAEEVLADRADRRRKKMADRRKLLGDRAQFRLVLISAVFLACFGALGGKMAILAASEPSEPRISRSDQTETLASGRRAIVDRRGRLLAVDLPVHAIYAHPRELKAAGVDPKWAAKMLAQTIDGVDEEEQLKLLSKRKGLIWVKRPATPVERQKVHDLGIPGVHFGERETRVYPAGRMGAHILGGYKVEEETVFHATLAGRSGVERALDEELRDPHKVAEPLALSIDLTAQTALTRIMDEALKRYRAKAGVAVLMDVRNGEVISLVSLPDFDPNFRPDANADEVKAVRPMMNRAAEGVFELGSTFKLFLAAQALDQGVARLDTMVDTTGPIVMGGHKIRDFHRMPPRMSLRDVIIESSNTGTSRLALAIGPDAQKSFLGDLGFLKATSLEIAESRLGHPILPRNWGRLQTMTISFGHGLAATPLHLAAGYAAMVNGGFKVNPTLRKDAPAPTEADRVISTETSVAMRELLRAIVAEGTGRKANVPGYEVGGKTGTADKPKPGGYHRDKTIGTFASVFPTSNPKYVLIITLDEPVEYVNGKALRTAGWTAAPVTGVAIRHLAPILGMRPKPEIKPKAKNLVEARSQ